MQRDGRQDMHRIRIAALLASSVVAETTFRETLQIDQGKPDAISHTLPFTSFGHPLFLVNKGSLSTFTGNPPMNLLAILGIAVALAMDAFAVAIATGVNLKQVSLRQTFRLSWHFGLFQAMMPVIGWGLGTSVQSYMAAYDHWVAFVLLALVGSNMLREAVLADEDEENSKPRKDATKGMTLVMLSVATSIDALAIGLSMSMLQVSIGHAGHRHRHCRRTFHHHRAPPRQTGRPAHLAEHLGRDCRRPGPLAYRPEHPSGARGVPRPVLVSCPSNCDAIALQTPATRRRPLHRDRDASQRSARNRRRYAPDPEMPPRQVSGPSRLWPPNRRDKYRPVFF